jgi:serine/threonine protein kinase
MGVVYVARDLSLGRDVAVKLLRRAVDDPEMLTRLRREARTAARLSHRNIVPVYDVGIDDAAGAFLVMEYVRGVPLRQQVLPLAPYHVAEIGVQVCSALVEMHAKGVIHRDLKRQNLMLEVDEHGLRVRVLDFGVARLAGTEETITGDGAFVGTARYASPEQAEVGQIDERSDLYSLGVVLYELLTGSVPFDGPTDAATLYMHVHRPVPSLRSLCPNVPELLSALVMDCLAKDPQARPGDAAELRARLVAAQQTCPAVVPLVLAATADRSRMVSASGSLSQDALPSFHPSAYSGSTVGMANNSSRAGSLTVGSMPRFRVALAPLVGVIALGVGWYVSTSAANQTSAALTQTFASQSAQESEPVSESVPYTAFMGLHVLAATAREGASHGANVLAAGQHAAASMRARDPVRPRDIAGTVASDSHTFPAEHEVPANPHSGSDREPVVSSLQTTAPQTDRSSHDRLREELGAIHGELDNSEDTHDLVRREVLFLSAGLAR